MNPLPLNLKALPALALACSALTLVRPAGAQTPAASISTANPVALGSRVLYRIPGAAAPWLSSEGVTAIADTHGFTLGLDGPKTYGWAAPPLSLPLEPDQTLAVTIATHATGILQLEWIRPDGSFITATKAIDLDRASPPSIQINALVPPGEKPASFKLKFWLQGIGQKAVLSNLEISAPRAWKTPGVTASHRWTGDSPFTADSKIDVVPSPSGLTATLKSQVGYASFGFSEKYAYDPHAIVALDLTALKGRATLQFAAFDAAGKYLKSVDVIKDVSKIGFYQTPLDIYLDDFGAGVSQVAPVIWVVGNDATATVGGVFWGKKA